jgi:hypothetical protein
MGRKIAVGGADLVAQFPEQSGFDRREIGDDAKPDAAKPADSKMAPPAKK